MEANLQLGHGKRTTYTQRKVGGDDRLSSDDGGQLIAIIFKGSGDSDNLVPMNDYLNRGQYRMLENTWRTALNKEKNHYIQYIEQMVPDRIGLELTIV